MRHFTVKIELSHQGICAFALTSLIFMSLVCHNPRHGNANQITDYLQLYLALTNLKLHHPFLCLVKSKLQGQTFILVLAKLE